MAADSSVQFCSGCSSDVLYLSLLLCFSPIGVVFSLVFMSKAEEFNLFSMRTDFLVRIQSQNSFPSEQRKYGCLWGQWL